MPDRIELLSIKDSDLRSVLGHHGYAELLDQGNARCAACGAIITWDNLGAILVDHKTLVLFCDLSECIDSAGRGPSACKT